LQVPDMEKAALGSGPFRNNIDALTTPAINTAEPQTLQARRLAKLFFLTPDVAATIARLAYGAGQ
jgi:hypothetical protein